MFSEPGFGEIQSATRVRIGARFNREVQTRGTPSATLRNQPFSARLSSAFWVLWVTL